MVVEDEEMLDFAQENEIFSALIFNGMCVDDPTFKCLGSIDEEEDRLIDCLDEYEVEMFPENKIRVCGERNVSLFEEIAGKKYSSIYDELVPSGEYGAVVLEEIGYKRGQITTSLEVEKNFKWSDISIIWRNLEWSTDEFVGGVVYVNLGPSELEVLGVVYRNQFFESYDYADFSGGASSELSCYLKTSDGNFELIR